jgi:hypothetical protein
MDPCAWKASCSLGTAKEAERNQPTILGITKHNPSCDG